MDTLTRMLTLAETGIAQLHEAQQAALQI